MAESLMPTEAQLHPALRRALWRMDALVDWERRDRAPAGAGWAMRVDLGPMRDLVERLDHPERRFRAVHVAGTKGKGSVASLVAAALARLGLCTGLYGSPHVERIHERVRLGGLSIGDEPLAAALERALEARDAALAAASGGARATWFDVLTAAAFVALAEAGVDWAALECGLGGRLDSTNVLPAEVAVITNVDLEHTAILGTTRAAIAAEKAGIVKPGASVVSGVGAVESDEAAAVVARVARERGSPLTSVAIPEDAGVEERNVRLAGAVLDELGRRGLAGAGASLLDSATIISARLPGRLERFVHRGVAVVLDGAHVPSSVALVLRDLAREPGHASPPTAVLALGRDKDAPGILKALQGRVDRVLCTRPGPGPFRTAEMLLEAARETGLEAEAFSTPEAALARAVRLTPPAGWILVLGSLHLAGALRPLVARA